MPLPQGPQAQPVKSKCRPFAPRAALLGLWYHLLPKLKTWEPVEILPSRSPPALTHPRSPVTSLLLISPRVLLLPCTAAAWFCAPSPLPGPALLPGTHPRQLHTSCSSFNATTSRLPLAPPYYPSDPLLGFHFPRLIPNICPGNKALQHLTITVFLTSLPQHPSFLLALPNNEQSFKRLHFFPSNFKKLW